MGTFLVMCLLGILIVGINIFFIGFAVITCIEAVRGVPGAEGLVIPAAVLLILWWCIQLCYLVKANIVIY